MIRLLSFLLVGIVTASCMLLSCLQSSFGQVDPPGNLKRQTWEDIAEPLTKGLTPLYLATGKECLKVLNSNKRWAVLPRPINSVRLSLESKPCFVMDNGISYYKRGNAVRWAAEQNWDGEFKLLLKKCEAWVKDEIVLSDMSFLDGDQWTSYKSPSSKSPSGRFGGGYHIPTLARAEKGSWWWASRTGIFRIENGEQTPVEIDGWEEGLSPQGIVSDEKGRAVVWSSGIGEEDSDSKKKLDEYRTPHYARVAYFDRKKWHTIKLPKIGVWNSARIREDGSFVLAGSRHHIFVPPLNGDNLDQVQAKLDPANKDLSESERTHTASGHIKVGNIWCKRRQRFVGSPGRGRLNTTFGMTLGGEMLFSATKETDEGLSGLVKIDKNNKATWIGLPQDDVRRSKFTQPRDGKSYQEKYGVLSSNAILASSYGLRIAAKSDGSFVVLDRKRGLYQLDSNSGKLSKLAETQLEDVLLGCDKDGRVYIRRGESLLALKPSAKPGPTIGVREHYKLFSALPPKLASKDNHVYRTSDLKTLPLAATIDSQGNILAIGTGLVRRKRNGFEWTDNGPRLKLLQTGDDYPKRVPASRIRLWPDGTLRLVDRKIDSNGLEDAQSIWPGRDGWSLVLCADNCAALINPDKKEVLVEESLLELATNEFEKMLAAAPLQSMDRRYNLLSRQYRRSKEVKPFAASPWLAIGNSVWVSTPKRVYRLERGTVAKAEADESSAPSLKNLIISPVGSGGAEMMGPIAGGELILQPFPDSSKRRPSFSKLYASSLLVVGKPKEDGEIVSATEYAGKSTSFNGSQAEITGNWFLDSKKTLWVDHRSDRAYQLESAREWPSLDKVGDVHFEDQSGAIWGYHSARVFPGYERINTPQKNSVPETYLHHLKPLASYDGHVICLTPTGLAKIKVDPTNVEPAVIAASTEVQWPGKIRYCLGVTDEQIWFVMQHEVEGEVFDVLVSVPLKWTLKHLFQSIIKLRK